MLSGILVATLTVLSFQKWNKYEAARPVREMEQRLVLLLKDRPIRLNPTLAKQTVPLAPIKDEQENSVTQEERKPTPPAM